MEGGFFTSEEPTLSKRDVDETLSHSQEPSHTCVYCGSLFISAKIGRVFGIYVCTKCARAKLPMITKTKCKEEYLLTDEDLMKHKHMDRPNPHQGSWHDMQLYIEEDIIRASIQKYGSEEEIRRIRDERKVTNRERRMGKIKRQVGKLKQKVFIKPREPKHRHVFKSDGQQCVCECGFTVKGEEI